MFKVISCAALLLATQITTATNIPFESDVLERPSTSNPWVSKNLTPLEKEQSKLELVIAVKQNNVDILEETVIRVSTPSSASYGKHLTVDEVHDLLEPNAEDIKSVVEWLTSKNPQLGITHEDLNFGANGEFITVTMSVKAAEDLLATEYQAYTYKNQRLLRTKRGMTYSLPVEVAGAVDFVAPTHFLPDVRNIDKYEEINKQRKVSGLLGNTPSSLRKLYNVGDVKGSGPTNSTKQAVTGFLNQRFSAADLSEFYTLFGHSLSKPKIGCVGDACSGGSGTESMLDAEYITALGNNLRTEFWGFSGNSPDNKNNEPFLRWLMTVDNTTDSDVPKLFSTSYGEPESSVSLAWAERLNREFQKVGARGISLLFASGDSGTACSDGKFYPTWPAGSPWVTAVGGTGGSNPESTASLSSGGFSNRWAAPSWQKDAIASYKTNAKAAGNLPPASYFNQTGAGIPDIAAQAEGFVVVTNRIPLPGVAGTSCASPTAAGIFGLINDLRMSKGKSSLGFLNPFLYSSSGSASFNDITRGANAGCGLSQDGFTAVKGWDPATGHGTPDFEKLMKSALQN